VTIIIIIAARELLHMQLLPILLTKAIVALQIIGGQVDPPIEFIPLYDMLATMQTQCTSKTQHDGASTSDNPVAAAASSVKSKGVFKKLFSKKDKS